MSFILDALRKSEKERQKAQVPGIGDAPLVVHRNRVPRWTMGVIAGLIACLAVLVWAWLRQTGPDTGPAPAAANAPSQEFDLGTVTVVPASSTIPPSVSPPASAPASVPASVSASVSASVPVSSPVTASDSPPESPPISSAVSSSPPTQPEVAAAPMLTLAQYRASGGSLPELNLELHVYSPDAADRFVFINSVKYVEGQTLDEGPSLGAITQEGAVLVHQGRSLLLPRE